MTSVKFEAVAHWKIGAPEHVKADPCAGDLTFRRVFESWLVEKVVKKWWKIPTTKKRNSLPIV